MKEENSIQSKHIKNTNKINMSKSLLEAINEINNQSGLNSTIYFGGSLYFIGEVLQFNNKK